MGKYRNRLEIIADILSIVEDGARKTHIMYEANLSYSLLNKYLKTIVSAGLVTLDGNGVYQITDKGRLFLEKCDEFFKDFKHLTKLQSRTESKREKIENLLDA